MWAGRAVLCFAVWALIISASCKHPEEYYRYTVRHQQTLAEVARELALDDEEAKELADYNQLGLDVPLEASRQVRIPRDILSKDEREFMEMVERSRAYYTKGDFASAEALLRKLVEEMPGLKGLYYQLGLVLWQENATEEAYRYLTLAGIDLSDDPDVAFALGTVAMELGRPYAAVQHFLDSLSILERAIYRYSLSLAYYEIGDAELALKEMKTALAMEGLPQVLRERALEYEQQMKASLAGDEDDNGGE